MVNLKQMESLKKLLLQAETKSLSTTNSEERKELSDMLSESLKPTRDPNHLRRWYRQLRFFVLDSWQRIWVIALWLTIMAILFAYKYIQYKNRAVYEVLGPCVCLAKGAAETLKLNMALILLPVCRNTITWLRNKTSWLGVFVPFDDNLNFHKVKPHIFLAILIFNNYGSELWLRHRPIARGYGSNLIYHTFM